MLRVLSASQRESLLTLARAAAASAARGEADTNAGPAPEGLDRPGAAFVTLHVSGALHGCIGTFQADDSLWETVHEMAIAAARRDPRFPPLAERDVPELDVEISVLSPPHRVSHHSEIEIGRHGLEIRRGRRRGLLLPQVATEHDFDRERFLAETCRKAGLPADSWRDPETEIWIFEAEVFGDRTAARGD
jgi:AmmeMemoRadiSam system protein A